MGDLNYQEEVDVLKELPDNFFRTLDSKKWSERRDALQEMLDLLQKNSRLDSSANYEEIASELKKIIGSDSNVVVVGLAIQVLTGLAKGLRRKFGRFIPMILPVLLEKFKEKKAVVKRAVAECVDALNGTCSLEALMGPITEALEKSSNQDVKLGIISWIYRILLHCEAKSTPHFFIKTVVPFIAQNLSDRDAGVREAASMTFGGIMRLVDEKTACQMAGEQLADKTKLTKVKHYRDKAVEEAAALEEKLKAEQMADEGASGISADQERNELGLNSGNANFTEVDPWERLEESDINGKLPNNFLQNVSSKKWSERKEALETLLGVLEENPRLNPREDHRELLGLLRKILEKDSNVNVAAFAAKSILGFSKGLRHNFSSEAQATMASAFEKFKERKAVLREPLIDCVDSIASVVPFANYVESIEAALAKPNPQIKAQTALFVSRVWAQHGKNTLPVDGVRRLAGMLDKQTSDSDQECRDGAYAAIGAAMKSIGEEGVVSFFVDISRDSIRMEKVREHRDKFMKEFGESANEVMLRLHKAWPPEKKVNRPLNDPQTSAANRANTNSNRALQAKRASGRSYKGAVAIKRPQIVPGTARTTVSDRQRIIHAERGPKVKSVAGGKGDLIAPLSKVTTMKNYQMSGTSMPHRSTSVERLPAEIAAPVPNATGSSRKEKESRLFAVHRSASAMSNLNSRVTATRSLVGKTRNVVQTTRRVNHVQNQNIYAAATTRPSTVLSVNNSRPSTTSAAKGSAADFEKRRAAFLRSRSNSLTRPPTTGSACRIPAPTTRH